MKIDAATLVALALVACGHRATPPGEALATAQRTAAARGVPVLVVLEGASCLPCKWFTRDAEQDPALRSSLERVVVLRLDAASDEGRRVRQRYTLEVQPAFALVDTRGALLAAWVGYGRAEDWKHAFDAALADPRPVEQKARACAESRSAELAAVLGRDAVAHGDQAAGLKYYKAARDLSSPPNAEYATLVFYLEWERYLAHSSTVDPAAAAADAAMRVEPGDDYYRAAVGYNLLDAERLNQPALARKYIDPAIRSAKRLPEREKRTFLLALETARALRIEHDPDHAFEIRRSFMPQGWYDKPALLDALADWCFANDVHVDDAAKLARRAIELGKGDLAVSIGASRLLAEDAEKSGHVDEARALRRKVAALEHSTER